MSLLIRVQIIPSKKLLWWEQQAEKYVRRKFRPRGKRERITRRLDISHSLVSKTEMYESRLICLLNASCWFLVWLILRPWRWRRVISPTRSMTFNRLYSIMSHPGIMLKFPNDLTMEMSPSWQISICTPQIPNILSKHRVHYRAYKSPPLADQSIPHQLILPLLGTIFIIQRRMSLHQAFQKYPIAIPLHHICNTFLRVSSSLNFFILIIFCEEYK
jgi:hypothetical protein